MDGREGYGMDYRKEWSIVMDYRKVRCDASYYYSVGSDEGFDERIYGMGRMDVVWAVIGGCWAGVWVGLRYRIHAGRMLLWGEYRM